MSSDVCKHCTHAACLDVCPTGSLFRTEFGTVVVQDDICNGCGYCVPACPFGVIDRRVGEKGAKNVGIAQKCTLCYDRLGDGHDAGVRAGLPDPVDPVRRPRRAARARRRAGRRRCTRRASPTPGSTARTPTTASAAPARCSCCSTSPRSTACRRTRWSPPATCRRCGSRPAWPRPALLGRGRRLVPRGAVTTAGDAPAAGSHRARADGADGAAAAGDGAPGGAGRDVHLLLRPAGGQGLAVGGRHPGLPVPRRPGGRVVAARRRRRPDRPPGAAPHRPARRAGRDHASASPRWCTTSGARPASSTCCAWPSRPRRCRSAPGSSRSTARPPGWPARPSCRPAAARWPALARCCGPFARPAGLGAAAGRPGRRRPTPPCCWPTPRRRPGTRPTASCRSCSSARPPAAAGGLGMIGAPVDEAGPARRLAVAGAARSSWRPSSAWSARWAWPPRPLHQGRPGRSHARPSQGADGVGRAAICRRRRPRAAGWRVVGRGRRRR